MSTRAAFQSFRSPGADAVVTIQWQEPSLDLDKLYGSAWLTLLCFLDQEIRTASFMSTNLLQLRGRSPWQLVQWPDGQLFLPERVSFDVGYLSKHALAFVDVKMLPCLNMKVWSRREEGRSFGLSSPWPSLPRSPRKPSRCRDAETPTKPSWSNCGNPASVSQQLVNI